MFGIDLISLSIGVFVGAGLGEGARMMINGWRKRAVAKVKDVYEDIHENVSG
jgi:hypothetical protein